MLEALTYLARHTNWLMHRQEAEQAYDELIHACVTIRNAVDAGAEQRYAGPCDVCGRDMYAAPAAAFALCAPCNLEYPMRHVARGCSRRVRTVSCRRRSWHGPLLDWVPL